MVKATRLLTASSCCRARAGRRGSVARPSGSSTDGRGDRLVVAADHEHEHAASRRRSAPPVSGASTRWWPGGASRSPSARTDGRAVGRQVDEHRARVRRAGPLVGDGVDDGGRRQRQQRDVGRRRRATATSGAAVAPSIAATARGVDVVHRDLVAVGHEVRWRCARRCSPARSHRSPIAPPRSRGSMWTSDALRRPAASVQRADSSVRDSDGEVGRRHGAPRPRHLRQRSARDGAAGPVGALHRPGVRPRRAEGALARSRATCGCGSRTTRCCGSARPRPQHVDGRKTGWREEHDDVYADVRGQRAGTPQSQIDAMDAEGLDLAVLFPSPRPVRARPRLGRADRHRRPRAGVRHRHRPGLQRLAEGLLRPRARPHVRRRHGGAPTTSSGAVARGPALRRGARLQGDLPAARLR